MTASPEHAQEFESGEVVEPGEYIDIETGARVIVQERDELPGGSRIVQFRRRFRRIDSFTSSRIYHTEL